MADNKKISELDQIQSLSDSDEFVVVDKSTNSGNDAGSSGKTSRVTLSQIKMQYQHLGQKVTKVILDQRNKVIKVIKVILVKPVSQVQKDKKVILEKLVKQEAKEYTGWNGCNGSKRCDWSNGSCRKFNHRPGWMGDGKIHTDPTGQSLKKSEVEILGLLDMHILR